MFNKNSSKFVEQSLRKKSVFLKIFLDCTDINNQNQKFTKWVGSEFFFPFSDMHDLALETRMLQNSQIFT